MKILPLAIKLSLLVPAIIAAVPNATAETCEVVLREMQTLVQPYEGECKEGKAHGRGRYTSSMLDNRSQPVTLTYEGEFRDGMLNGQGVRRDNRNAVFTGQYQNNLPNGPGSWTTPSFEEKGEYRNGVLAEGVRRVNRPDGSQIIMQMVAGKQAAQCHSGRDPSQEKDCTPALLAQLGIAPAVSARSPAQGEQLRVIKACSYASAFDAPALLIMTAEPGRTPAQYREQAAASMPRAVEMSGCKPDMHLRLFLLTPAQSAKCGSVNIQAGTRDFLACVDGPNALLAVHRTNRGLIQYFSHTEFLADQEQKRTDARRQQDQRQSAAADAARDAEARNNKAFAEILASARNLSKNAPAFAVEPVAQFAFEACKDRGVRFGVREPAWQCRDLKVGPARAMPVSRADSANGVQSLDLIAYSMLVRKSEDDRWGSIERCVIVERNPGGTGIRAADSLVLGGVLSCNNIPFDLQQFRWTR